MPFAACTLALRPNGDCRYHFETPGGPGVPGDAAHTAAVGSTAAHDTAAAAAAAAAVRAAPLGGNSIDQIAVVPPGLYMWGPVGCGKTMIMDMFYENADVRHFPAQFRPF